MEFESARIIDSNGTKYKVGWDEHGWFSIGRVELDLTVSHDDADPEDYTAVESGEWASFGPYGAADVLDAIEEGL